MRHVKIFLVLASLTLLTSSEVAQCSNLDRGHQILLQKGLQLQALVLNNRSFDQARWDESNFTTINLWARTNIQDLLAPPPGSPWARWAGSGPVSWFSTLTFSELPYLPNMVSFQAGDEQDLSNPANVDVAVSVLAQWRDLYPDVIGYVNQTGGVSNTVMQNFMQQAQPDMLMFDPYRMTDSDVGGSHAIFYSDWAGLQKFRQLALAGNDGTGNSPIPYALYTQTFYDTSSRLWGRPVSESEMCLNQFAAWAFGYTFINSFIYNKIPQQHGGNTPIFFNGPNLTDPTAAFYQVAELNRQSLNLGPALTRLISTDIRMIMGQFLIELLGDNKIPVNNRLPSGMSEWNASADPYITNIAATNLGGNNDGLRGDVIIGYFKPLDESFDGPQYNDEIYWMVVNGLSDGGGLAVETQQSIRIDFDFRGSGIDRILRLSRQEGTVEVVPLVSDGGSRYHLDLVLDGGMGDLFKFNTGAPFVILELSDFLAGDANRDGVVSADDYASVQDNFGKTYGPELVGDANDDGVVSADDYASVQAHFGDTEGLQSNRDVAIDNIWHEVNSIPEPVSLIMFVLGLVFLNHRRSK